MLSQAFTAIVLAPPQTQLLLLSGSVANPQDIVKWFTRLGRQAVLIRHEHRPVPLEEVRSETLDAHVPSEIKGHWPRLVAKALAENLGPILIFAPRRQATEALGSISFGCSIDIKLHPTVMLLQLQLSNSLKSPLVSLRYL